MRVSDNLWFGLFNHSRKLEPKLVRVLTDLNTPQFVWIFFIRYYWVFWCYLMTFLNVIFLNSFVSYTNSFIFLSKATKILGLSHVLFNSKHDQCRACFEFCFLLLIWSTTAEKILKLWLFLLTYLSSCTWKLTQGPKIKYHKKWMLFSVKYMICGRMKKESSNLKMKDRHLNQKTIRSRWVIRFCVGE